MRARRLGSFALDLFFALAPWAAMLGSALSPDSVAGYGGVGVLIAVSAFGAVGTLVVLVLQLVVLLGFGRTLGMACTGIHVARGSRAGAVALAAGLVVTPTIVAAVVSRALEMDGTAAGALVGLTPLVALALDAAFAAGPSARTLVDRMSGVHVAPDPPNAPPARRVAGGIAIDVGVLLATGAPVLLGIDWSDFGGAAIASGFAALAVIALEVTLAARTKATLGMRAVRSRALP